MKKMLEYNVDTHTNLFAFVSDVIEEFGGNLSVRINGRRPVPPVGKGENTFHQYTFYKKIKKVQIPPRFNP